MRADRVCAVEVSATRVDRTVRLKRLPDWCIANCWLVENLIKQQHQQIWERQSFSSHKTPR